MWSLYKALKKYQWIKTICYQNLNLFYQLLNKNLAIWGCQLFNSDFHLRWYDSRLIVTCGCKQILETSIKIPIQNLPFSFYTECHYIEQKKWRLGMTDCVIFIHSCLACNTTPLISRKMINFISVKIIA